MNGTPAILLILIFVANGAPVLAWLLLKDRFTRPIDAGRTLGDGYRLFGSSKTWRGLLSSAALTPAAALLLGMPWQTGLLVSAGAMAGDLCSSFIKRRMGLAPSSMALGLDQIPEALVPLLLVMPATGLRWQEILALVFLFLLLELGLSRILYRWHLRKRPY